MIVTVKKRHLKEYGGEKFFDRSNGIDTFVTAAVPYKPSRRNSGSAFSMDITFNLSNAP